MLVTPPRDRPTVRTTKNNPTIQVIFADNHHAKRQARQFATVMQGLQSATT